MMQEAFEKLVLYVAIFGCAAAIGVAIYQGDDGPPKLWKFRIGERDEPVTLRTCEPGEVAPDCVWSMQHSSTGGGGTFTTAAAEPVAGSRSGATSTSGIIDLAPTYNTVRDCDGRVWERTSVGWVSWSKDGSNAHNLRSDRPECGPQQERP